MTEHPHARLAQLGPQAWAALHQWAAGFAQEVGDDCGCGKVAVAVTNAFHDRVNLELGKPVQDPANLAQVAEWFGTAALRQSRPDPWGSRCRDPKTGEWAVGGSCGPVPTDGICPVPARPAVTFATSADGVRRYEFVHKVVPADKLIPSHDPFTFQVNPAFGQVLQPRLRDRAAAELQVRNIAATLSPEALLTDFHTLDRGAPIIGPDRLVESGNGRVMGILRAIKDHPAVYAAYRAALQERARTFGVVATGVVNPVLVRERVTVLTQAERVEFVREANTPAGISRSAIEQARTDAEKVTIGMLEGLAVGDNESLFDALRAARNNRFVRGFLAGLPPTEQGQLVDAKGVINMDGVRRAANAVFVSAFGAGEPGLRLGEMAFESVDQDVKNVFNGISRSIGALAQAESLIRGKSRATELSIAGDLAAAIQVYAKIRNTPGMTVATYLAQAQMLNRELSKFQERMLQDLADNIRSAKRLGNIFRGYAESVIAQPPPSQGGLFGPRSGPNKEQLWAGAVTNRDREREPALTAQKVLAQFLQAKKTIDWCNVSEQGELRVLAWAPLRDLLYVSLGYGLKVQVCEAGFGGDQYQVTIGTKGGKVHPVQAAKLRTAGDRMGRSAKFVADFTGATLNWLITLPQEPDDLVLKPFTPEPERKRVDPKLQPTLFQRKPRRRKARRMRASGVVLETLPAVEDQVLALLKRHKLEMAQRPVHIVA